ncbi:CocE/NonD family hydrolase [Mesorhizobium sp. M0859]|uniref:CocE/NonD family hydrolase n=1 Tax=Mesorhizobium sp. M0859 TaxID=2957014 RepID=UPI00333610AA
MTKQSCTSQAVNFSEADVVRDISYVTTKDGTRIAYICYRPKSGRYPTVFEYTGYQASATRFEVAKPFLDAGYAFLGANATGTGCSTGAMDQWFSQIEGVHGAEVVEWIAEQPWSDGNVGMVGYSYGGNTQMWVAAERPPHLRAIVPSGIGDNYDCWAYLGGMLQLSSLQWAFDNESEIQGSGAQWRISQGDTECAIYRSSDRFVDRYPLFSDLIRQHPSKDEWWDSINPCRPEVAGKITVPTMIVVAFQDEWGLAKEGPRTFKRYMPDVKNKKLLLLNGAHASASAHKGYTEVVAEHVRFLDRWVKGIENGIDDEPPVKVLWEIREPEGDPKKSVFGWTTTHATWPEPSVERRPFYLTVEATLSPNQPKSNPDEGSRAYLYPVGTEQFDNDKKSKVAPSPGTHSTNGTLPLNYSFQSTKGALARMGLLNYRLAPVASDMTLLGNPEVRLYLSIDQGDDADLELTLKDVDPDGNVLFLQSGLQRASFREIDEALTNAEEVVPAFRKSEKLEPGKIYEIRMSLLGPIAHVVRKGHCLELTIGAPGIIPDRVIGSLPVGVPSVNRIYSSKEYASRINLPILPGAVAQAQTPEFGTLRNQPYRKEARFEPGGLAIK